MRYASFIPLDIERVDSILPSAASEPFVSELRAAATTYSGRTLWSINSTESGGGVAEMLVSLMGYAAGAGFDARWAVIEADPEFFELTKSIHNRLHGESDGPSLGEREREIYEHGLEPNAAELKKAVRPGDLVLVHDPQPAGLIPMLIECGAVVVWRCHIGADRPSRAERPAWEFLLPYVSAAHACVFSRAAYVRPGLGRVEIIPPSLDPFSPKNQELDAATVAGILVTAGIQEDLSNGLQGRAEPRFTRRDGSLGVVSEGAEMTGDGPVPADAPLIVQVSRWDSLKDPVGVVRCFAEHVPAALGAHLVLAGPGIESVSDDPEEHAVFADVERAAGALPAETRSLVHLARLPRDGQQNAAIVNALQRRATVVVQKSLAEGFGLTVAEAMWKERPVVAGRVGGIQDQIEHEVSGLLIDDPADDAAFGRTLTALLEDPERAQRIGTAARARVAQRFLPTRHLHQYVELARTVVPGEPAPERPGPSRSS